MTIVFFLLCAYAVMRFFRLAAVDGTKAYCGVMFWFYMSFILLIPGAHQLGTGLFPWPDSHSGADLLLALAIIVSGLASFEVGYRANVSFGLRIRPRPVRPARPGSSGFMRQASILPMFISTLIAAIFGLYLFNRFGVDWFLQWRRTFATAAGTALTLSEYGLTVSLGRGLALSSLLVGLLYFRRVAIARQRAPIRTILKWSLLLTSLALNAVVNNPAALPRYYLFGAVLICLFVAAAPTGRRLKLILFGSFPVMLYTVFPLVSSITRGQFYGSPIRMRDLGTYLDSADFDGMQQLLNTVSYVSANGHTFGHQTVSAALFFVPRSIWEGKAVPTGGVVGAEAGYNFLNLSASLFSELYIDFSLAGVIAGFFVLGRLLRKADRTMAAENAPVAVLIGAIAAGFLPILLRGALLGVIAPVAAVVFGVLLANCAAALSSAFSRGPPARGPAHRAPAPAVGARAPAR